VRPPRWAESAEIVEKRNVAVGCSETLDGAASRVLRLHVAAFDRFRLAPYRDRHARVVVFSVRSQEREDALRDCDVGAAFQPIHSQGCEVDSVNVRILL